MNDISKLRDHLFETLEGLKNKSIDIERAKAISETAQTIINSAKVEVDYIRVTGGRGSSSFLPALPAPQSPDAPAREATATGTKTTTPVPGGFITRHTMR